MYTAFGLTFVVFSSNNKVKKRLYRKDILRIDLKNSVTFFIKNLCIILHQKMFLCKGNI